jgi:hypothetical protein
MTGHLLGREPGGPQEGSGTPGRCHSGRGILPDVDRGDPRRGSMSMGAPP